MPPATRREPVKFCLFCNRVADREQDKVPLCSSLKCRNKLKKAIKILKGR